MTKKKLPVGVQTFSKIRGNDDAYVRFAFLTGVSKVLRHGFPELLEKDDELL